MPDRCCATRIAGRARGSLGYGMAASFLEMARVLPPAAEPAGMPQNAMRLLQASGYMASGLVVMAFCMKDIIALRCAAWPWPATSRFSSMASGSAYRRFGSCTWSSCRSTAGGYGRLSCAIGKRNQEQPTEKLPPALERL